MTWHPTRWVKPRTKKPLRVKFRNGIISKEALTADKWVWDDRDYDWDVVELKMEAE